MLSIRDILLRKRATTMNLIMFYMALSVISRKPHLVITINSLTAYPQMGGDPAPVVRWTRQGRESLPGTATVQHQGLAITNLHPSDQV